ncbi:MAG: hypothetical protein QMD80_04305 [archaeon]|nr:hypothetical protein [archaeon]
MLRDKYSRIDPSVINYVPGVKKLPMVSGETIGQDELNAWIDELEQRELAFEALVLKAKGVNKQ